MSICCKRHKFYPKAITDAERRGYGGVLGEGPHQPHPLGHIGAGVWHPDALLRARCVVRVGIKREDIYVLLPLK